MPKRLNDEIEQECCRLYSETDIVIEEIQNKLNICETTMYNILERNGILQRNIVKFNTINHNYFSEINSEEKAYLFGAIIGFTYKITDTLRIEFVATTRRMEILNKLSVAIYGNSDVIKTFESNTYSDGTCNVLYVSSKQIVNDLSKLGCNLSDYKTISFPKINEQYYRHFIRGLVDTSASVKLYRLSLSNNCSFLNRINEILHNLNFNSFIQTFKTKNSESYNLQITCGAEDNLKFMKWLYSDATIYLKKHYDLFQDLIVYEKQRELCKLPINGENNIITNELMEQIANHIKNGFNRVEISIKLNIDRRMMTKIYHTLNIGEKNCCNCKLEKEIKEFGLTFSKMKGYQLTQYCSLCITELDLHFKLKSMVNRMVKIALFKEDSLKNGESIIKYLPYTIKQLKEHIVNLFEDWMTWKNHGNYRLENWNDSDPSTWTWQLDHIIPQSKLVYTSMSDDNFQKCWALSNLRPLSAKQNVLDGAR